MSIQNTNTAAAQRQPSQVMYWRPKQISRKWLTFSMLVSLFGMMLVESLPRKIAPEHSETLKAASLKANEAFRLIGTARKEQGHKVIEKLDPQASHLIGPSMSMVTSKLGSLESKQTSINPNFSAVVVQWLRDAGVKPGDKVAIGASGSWPALNIAVYSACETMQLRPTIVLSAASSQYGANSPDMMWLDMERLLNEAKIFSFRAEAVSRGGLYDQASGMTEQTKQLLFEAGDRNGVPRLSGDTLRDSIRERMVIYDHNESSATYAAYINVGGGSASIGGSTGHELWPGGLYSEMPESDEIPDCVATRMLSKGIPLINVGNVKSVAKRYAMPIAPITLPRVGEGNVYSQGVYRTWLVAFVLALSWITMTITVAPERSLRFVQKLRGHNHPRIPEQVEWMV
ncbi:hypothetical protein Q31b_22080 [Novipirellula aureliae]|uniref:Poly-gamma-glutamate system protein n=1 Tax=Novipirellula aureliae TaxID=2527966 RepID=A0A5C6E2N4_9BACT|nr:poly-gamma-glutamate system protein [Novipirellula aureliae]TWU43170.1 hypothetical protein Q31b_22080 [Novipirellula aureliae]